MEKEADTDKILRAIAGLHDDLVGVHGEIGDLHDDVAGIHGDVAGLRDETAGIKAVMATKDDLKRFASGDDLAALKVEVAGLIHDEFAALRAEDIDPMKRDIQGVKADVQKIRDTFAPRLEIADRLRVIERKLGIPPQV